MTVKTNLTFPHDLASPTPEVPRWVRFTAVERDYYFKEEPSVQDIAKSVFKGVKTSDNNESPFYSLRTDQGGLKTQNKLTKTIGSVNLHVPNVSPITNNVRLRESDLAIPAEFLKGNVVGALTRLAIQQQIGTGLSDATSILTGKITNPNNELIFDGLSMRKFKFEYNFMFKNQKELDTIDEIIRFFRQHSAPTRGTGRGTLGSYLVYPKEWIVEYWMLNEDGQPTKNPYLPVYRPAMVSDIKVGFNPHGTNSFMEGGNPTQMTLAIEFTETEIVTGEEIVGETGKPDLIEKYKISELEETS